MINNTIKEFHTIKHLYIKYLQCCGFELSKIKEKFYTEKFCTEQCCNKNYDTYFEYREKMYQNIIQILSVTLDIEIYKFEQNITNRRILNCVEIDNIILTVKDDNICIKNVPLEYLEKVLRYDIVFDKIIIYYRFGIKLF